MPARLKSARKRPRRPFFRSLRPFPLLTCFPLTQASCFPLCKESASLNRTVGAPERPLALLTIQVNDDSFVKSRLRENSRSDEGSFSQELFVYCKKSDKIRAQMICRMPKAN
jgi:hypothetical protein